MNFKEIFFTIILIALLFIADLSLWSMISHLIRKEIYYLSDTEVSLIISTIFLCLELIIIKSFIKRKPLDIKYYVKEAREGLY